MGGEVNIPPFTGTKEDAPHMRNQIVEGVPPRREAPPGLKEKKRAGPTKHRGNKAVLARERPALKRTDD